MEIADAVTSDGWILGRKMLTLHDSGAYARFSPYGLTKHSFHHTGAYTIPNLSFDGYVVFTNRVPTTAMRGFGVTSVSFAVETHMNRIADVLDGSVRDPPEEREQDRRHVAERRRLHRSSTVPTIQAIADAIGHELPADYRTMTRDPAKASGFPTISPRRSATRRLTDGKAHRTRLLRDRVPDGHEPERRPVAGVDQDEADGRVDVFSGTADIGNGSKTIQTQIVAETLGVPYDWITYDNSNTDSSPLCTGTPSRPARRSWRATPSARPR